MQEEHICDICGEPIAPGEGVRSDGTPSEGHHHHVHDHADVFIFGNAALADFLNWNQGVKSEDRKAENSWKTAIGFFLSAVVEELRELNVNLHLLTLSPEERYRESAEREKEERQEETRKWREVWEERARKVLSVRCPKCEALPGEYCKTPSGNRTGLHQVRKLLPGIGTE